MQYPVTSILLHINQNGEKIQNMQNHCEQLNYHAIRIYILLYRVGRL